MRSLLLFVAVALTARCQQIVIAPACCPQLAPAQTQQYSANVPNVTWQANIGTMCPNGLYIAPASSPAVALVTITATSANASSSTAAMLTAGKLAPGASEPVCPAPVAASPPSQTVTSPPVASTPSPGCGIVVPAPVWTVSPPLTQQADGSWLVNQGVSIPQLPWGGSSFNEGAFQVIWNRQFAFQTVPPTWGITISPDGTSIEIDPATSASVLPFAAGDDVRVMWVFWNSF